MGATTSTSRRRQLGDDLFSSWTTSAVVDRSFGRGSHWRPTRSHSNETILPNRKHFQHRNGGPYKRNPSKGQGNDNGSIKRIGRRIGEPEKEVERGRERKREGGKEGRKEGGKGRRGRKEGAGDQEKKANSKRKMKKTRHDDWENENLKTKSTPKTRENKREAGGSSGRGQGGAQWTCQSMISK